MDLGESSRKIMKEMANEDLQKYFVSEYLIVYTHFTTLESEMAYLKDMSIKYELICVNNPACGGDDKYYFKKK